MSGKVGCNGEKLDHGRSSGPELGRALIAIKNAKIHDAVTSWNVSRQRAMIASTGCADLIITS